MLFFGVILTGDAASGADLRHGARGGPVPRLGVAILVVRTRHGCMLF